MNVVNCDIDCYIVTLYRPSEARAVSVKVAAQNDDMALRTGIKALKQRGMRYAIEPVTGDVAQIVNLSTMGAAVRKCVAEVVWS